MVNRELVRTIEDLLKSNDEAKVMLSRKQAVAGNVVDSLGRLGVTMPF